MARLKTGPWTRDETSASGQVFEFRVWAALTEQSRGHLHVFLPLSDRGIDALVHRLSDGVYIAVQAKGRSALIKGEVRLVVWASSVEDESTLIVAGLIIDGSLGPTMLVVPAADFRRLAELTTADGRPVYSMGFGMKLPSRSRWLPWLVPSHRLAERLALPPELAAIEEAPPPSWRSDLGFLGESEVVRRLAQAEDLNLFRPFPDSETSELAVRHRKSGQVVGLQVKTVSVSAKHPKAAVNVRASSFRPAPTTHFVVLSWMYDEQRFHDECLVIPSMEVRDIAGADSSGHFQFWFTPGSTKNSRLDGYRRSTVDLLAAVEELLVFTASA
jgi:hypothetical protein